MAGDTPEEAGKQLETVSMASQDDLARNLMHRVALDGSLDANALNLLNAIAVNTSLIGTFPEALVVYTSATSARKKLITCPPGSRIAVFDIMLSINAALNIFFENEGGTTIMAVMFAPNAGQGYTMNSPRGKLLPIGDSLWITPSADQVNFSIDVSYQILQVG